MNKEEIKELINDPIIKVKVTESTNILMDLYELGFNNGFKLSQSQLDIANNKLKEVKEYLISIKDEPDADMYIKLGEYDFYKNILSIIGSD